MHAEHVIKRPILLTEKASRLREDENKVIFEVDPKANKIQIKSAVEELFGVTVTEVNTSVMRGKDRRMGRGHARTPNWKKAVVTLKQGDDIQFFDESVEESESED
jgi:large subunit ribosomal protein L23